MSTGVKIWALIYCCIAGLLTAEFAYGVHEIGRMEAEQTRELHARLEEAHKKNMEALDRLDKAIVQNGEGMNKLLDAMIKETRDGK